MTKPEYLLSCLAEECNEVAQRAIKAQRFTLGEVQPGQGMTNAERIASEFADLMGVYEMLLAEGLVPEIDRADVEAKKKKVDIFMAYSQRRGCLEVKP